MARCIGARTSVGTAHTHCERPTPSEQIDRAFFHRYLCDRAMHGLAPVRAVTRCRRRGLDRRLAVEFRADRLDALGVRLRDTERLRRDVLALQAAHRAANRFADLRAGLDDGAQTLGEAIVDLEIGKANV